MSPELNKLIFDKMFSAVKDSIWEIDYFWYVMKKREEVRLNGEIPAIFDSSRITVAIERMSKIREKVFAEINEVLQS